MGVWCGGATGRLTELSAQIRVPAINPTGESIFLPPPNSTYILGPFNRQSAGPSAGQPVSGSPGGPALIPRTPPQSAFPEPPTPPPCENGVCPSTRPSPPGPVERATRRLRQGKFGEIIMTPSRIIAPVGSEVAVLTGICGENGHFALNQPLEWMLSNDSVGQIVEVGGTDRSVVNRLFPPSAKKVDGDYAVGRTLNQGRLVDRGTPTCVDDIKVLKGQGWISVYSASPGTSYLTCVAPKAEAWDKRIASTIIHWVDATWQIPAPARATAGTVFPLTASVQRATDGSGLSDYKIVYEIVSGVPAEFAPGGTQKAEVVTDASGQATVQIRQPAGQVAAGQTNVRVDVIQPATIAGREIVLESGITSVIWSSPALTIRAIGPRFAGIGQPFEYRVEVTNPGDQLARDVVVRSSDFNGDVEYVSSNPKPSQFGNQYEWSLGDVQPGAAARVIDIQLRSEQPGVRRLCFEVASSTDNLQTEACAETQIAAPCIGLQIAGPTEARVGESVSFDFTIINQCDQALEDVNIEVRYDEGLAAPNFASPIVTGPIDSIAAGGEYKIPTLTFDVQQPGTRCLNIQVTAREGHSASARRCLEVNQVVEPKVQLSMESHRVVRVGDNILVRMAVDNVGNVPLEDVSLLVDFADSMTPLRRSPTPMRWVNDQLRFDIGRIEPDSRQIVEVVFGATDVDGNAECQATVVTPLGQSDATSVSVRIEPADAALPPSRPSEDPIRVPPERDRPERGSDAAPGNLSVEVQALDRAVQVDDEVVFQVSVRNMSNADDQNVKITLLVPPGIVLRDAGESASNLRVVDQSADGSLTELEPRRTLRGNEVISFPVTLQAVQPGQSTFEASVSSDRLPVATSGRDSVQITQ